MKRIGRLILIWIGVVAITLIGIHAILIAVTGARLRAAYKALEDAGRPMTAAEIISPEIPEADNAAPLYLKAFELLEKAGEQDWCEELEEIAAEDELPTNAVTAARELLAREEIQEALALIKEATTRAGCRFERDYSAGAALLLPEVGQFRNTARLVKLSALVDDGEGASALLIVGLNMAGALESDPILISQLVRISVANMMLATVQEVYAEKTMSDSASAQLMTKIVSMRNGEGFIRSLDGERLLFGEWAFSLFMTRKGADELAALAEVGNSPVVVFYGGRFLRPLWQADHAVYMRLMHVMTQEALKPVYAAQPLDDKLEGMIPRYCLLTRMLLPALGQVAKVNADGEARLALTQAGIALIRHKERHGAYPETPAAIDEDFLEEWPVDPFTGKPFVYRTTPDGTTLYSVGMNAKDDGGTASEERREGDIVWALP